MMKSEGREKSGGSESRSSSKGNASLVALKAWETKRARGYKPKPVSDETRAKLRAIQLGRRPSELVRQKMSAAHVGKKQSLETRKKRSAALSGRAPSEACRLAASTFQRGAVRSQEQRSKIAIGVVAYQATHATRSSGTAPEIAVQKLLEARGVAFVAQFVHPEDPYHIWDFAIPSLKILIEVDGCYWHGCERCGHAASLSNRRSDAAKNAWAKKLGWRLVRIRECELENGKRKAA